MCINQGIPLLLWFYLLHEIKLIFGLNNVEDVVSNMHIFIGGEDVSMYKVWREWELYIMVGG